MLIGIDLGATNVRVGRVVGQDLAEVVSAPIAQSEDPETLLTQIKELIQELMHPDVHSIGIGVPSVVDVEKGIVYDVQNIPSWKEVPLKEIIEHEFGIPTWVNNDANCFALGERYFGQAKDRKHVIGLIIGTGFGAGVILNGALVSGAHCGTGEVGMLPYQGSILEHYCSGQFFERFFSETGSEVYEKAVSGDTEAQAKYLSFAKHIAEGIKAILYAYDPEMIVLGGATSKVWSYIEETVWENLSTFSYPQSLKNLIITPSHLEHVAVLGAAALAMDATASKW